MRTNFPNWPALLQDAGWREQKIKGQYWPSYFRRRWSQAQRVTWNEYFGTENKTAWVLEVDCRYVAHGSLDKVLYLAESFR